jgi:hypothetical protein
MAWIPSLVILFPSNQVGLLRQHLVPLVERSGFALLIVLSGSCTVRDKRFPVSDHAPGSFALLARV